MIVTDKQKSRLTNIDCELKGIHDIKSEIFISSALQWIRENKGIDCGVSPKVMPTDEREITYQWVFFGVEKENITYKQSSLLDKLLHLEAESELLDEILEYLEDKKQE